MTWVLYYVMNYLMVAGIRLSSRWNDKSKKWINGRKDWHQKISLLPKKKGRRIWFHVASLGEFEQARPVIEQLKNKSPDIDIILTFFSPSGYEIKANYPLAKVFYLPADIPGNAPKWIKALQPDLAVFVKYDLWPGYLKALQQEGIQTILISAHWTPGKLFHSSTIPPTKNLLRNFNKIFLQKDEHLEYFKKSGFQNLDVAGDTRMDRSLELPNEVEGRMPEALKDIRNFDLVAGSTWPRDEKILLATAEALHLRMIIAPHDVSEANIIRLMKSLLFPAVRLSELQKSDTHYRVVVIDSIGVLNILYPLGKVAYVGGGFGKGIHNTLEPIAHRKPVIFGPHYKRFPEAVDLIAAKAAWTITSQDELFEVFKNLSEPQETKRAGEAAFNYLSSHCGASEKITNYILESMQSNN